MESDSPEKSGHLVLRLINMEKVDFSNHHSDFSGVAFFVLLASIRLVQK